MNAIVAALSARHVDSRDIQTRSFKISPQYDFVEVVHNGVRTRSQVLVGFRVTNSATAKIRDLEAVGAIIDEVSEAAGDAVRINGVGFTVEDTGRFAAQLREAAVRDPLTKADHLASLAGVSLGPLVFITESTAPTPENSAHPSYPGARYSADTAASQKEIPDASRCVEAIPRPCVDTQPFATAAYLSPSTLPGRCPGALLPTHGEY